MSDYPYEIAHNGAINPALLDDEMRTALPNKTDGISGRAGFITVHFINAPSAQDQTDAQAVLAAHDPNVLTPAQAHAAELASLAASMSGATDRLAYFNALQEGLKDVVVAGTPLATFFPGMRNLLTSDPDYYEWYINVLTNMTTVTQPDFETNPLPTAAQMRASYQVAALFSIIGLVQSIHGDVTP